MIQFKIYLQLGRVFCISISILMTLSFFLNFTIYKHCKKERIKELIAEEASVNQQISEEAVEGDVSVLSTSFLLFFFFLFVSLFQHITYLWVFFKNPGIVYKPEYSPTTSRRVSVLCTICKAFKNSQRLHCTYCEICIEEYSHHCPWIGKCVGMNNHTSFQLLKFLTALYFLVGIFALLWQR